jgi:hypothetical protein
MPMRLPSTSRGCQTGPVPRSPSPRASCSAMRMPWIASRMTRPVPMMTALAFASQASSAVEKKK